MPELYHVIHSESIALNISTEKAAEFISLPEAILDYYPYGKGGKKLEGDSLLLWTKPLAGCVNGSYLQRKSEPDMWPSIQGAQPDFRVVYKVHVAMLFSTFRSEPLESAEQIQQKQFFSMWEDWQIYRQTDGRCCLEKLWLNLEQHKWPCLPISKMVSATAKKESAKIQKNGSSVLAQPNNKIRHWLPWQ